MADNPNNFHSPYFLHHSDNHGSVTITTELTTSNYSAWSRSFMLELSIRNKRGFVDGTIQKSDRDDPLFPAWSICNDLIVSWLLKSITPSIATTVFYFISASHIWNVLQKHFSQTDDVRICRLQQQLCVVVQGNRTIDEYFNELHTLCEELKMYRPLPHCSCGDCNNDCFEKFRLVYEKDCMFKFLNGLNDVYAGVRSQIVATRPLPSLDDAYNTVVREETQRSKGQSSVIDMVNESSVLMARTDTRRNMRNNADLVCSYCKKAGHVKANCYKLVGFPPDFKFRSKPRIIR